MNSTFEIPAKATLHQEARCTVPEDVSIVMFANHLHQWGKKIRTYIEEPSGITVLKNDPVWVYEWTTNPNFEFRTLDDPLVVKAGTTLVTECDWENDTSAPLTYPAEMCAFASFHLGDHDAGCLNGLSAAATGN
jgi:hypothetical protein